MNWLEFILAALAVYRVSRMIAMEDGPADVFARLRDKAGQSNWIGRGLNCPMCISFWLGFITAWPIANSFYFWVIGALAMSAVTVIIHKRIY